MGKSSMLMSGAIATAFMASTPASAQEEASAASSAASADTLPADPAVAPWAPPGGRVARIQPSADCRPGYPRQAARAMAQGTTIVMFTIDAEGKLVDGAVLKSAGETRAHKLLDQQTLRVFANCGFVAGVDANGRPVTTRLKLTYTWKLE